MDSCRIRFLSVICAFFFISLSHTVCADTQDNSPQPGATPNRQAGVAGGIESLKGVPTKAGTPRTERVRDAIDAAFNNLSHPQFAVRQVASQFLTNAGSSVIPELQNRALTNDVDFQNTCLNIIAWIGRKENALDAAAHALKSLSKDRSFASAGRAAEKLSDLTKRQSSRAIRLLTESGAKLQRNGSDGHVYSISNVTEDKQCEQLQHLPYLSYLALNGAQLTDGCIKPLSEAARLQSINLGTTSITPKGMSELKFIGNINHLTLFGKYSAAHIRALEEVKQLTVVQFARPVGDEELLAAAALPLSDVLFSKITVSGQTADIIKTFKSRRMRFSMSSIENSDLLWLNNAKTPPLNLSIYNSAKLTDEGIRHLENANITTLTLSNTGITSESLKRIGAIEALQNLTITNSPIDDESLGHLSSLKRLVSLRLQGSKVTGDGMTRLKETLQTLRITQPPATRQNPNR